MSNNQGKAWVFVSVGEEKLWEGNDGYQDDTGKRYDYDGFVANHKQVQAGDIIFLSNKKQIVGTSVIDSIETWPGSKMFNRCPYCDSSALGFRTAKFPPYRCKKCLQEFIEIRRAPRECIKYRAHYRKAFTAVTKPVLADSLYVKKIDQQSIGQIHRLVEVRKASSAV